MKEQLLTPSAGITIPSVFIEAFKDEPDYKLNPVLKPPDILGLASKPFVVISRHNLSEVVIKENVFDWRKYRRGSGRGECYACINGQEVGHHGGSRCKRRGMLGFFNTKPYPIFSISKLPSKPSGLY